MLQSRGPEKKAEQSRVARTWCMLLCTGGGPDLVVHRFRGRGWPVSGPVPSLARMTIQIPVRMPAFMRVELTVDGRPDADRVIQLPIRAPLEWIVEAYCLSLGLDPSEQSDADGYEHCHHAEPYAYPWPSVPSAEELPPLPYDPHVVVRPVEVPPLGTPWITVSRPAGSPSPAPSGSWLTEAAPFREDAVNRELLRAHGVVQPYFDDGDLWSANPGIPDGSPLAALARALAPARRLALLAHVDDLDLIRNASPDYSEAESALAPLARLVEMIGDAGLPQDPESGWVSDADTHRVADSLGWGGTQQETRARGRALVSFARTVRFVRRFKGRVVSTTMGRRMVVPTTHTLDFLARMVLDPEDQRPSYHPRDVVGEASALLAIADGSVQHLADLSQAASEAREALTESAGEFDVPVRGYEPVALIDGLSTRLSLLSEEEFGRVTPSMREVARLALIGGGRFHHYA